MKQNVLKIQHVLWVRRRRNVTTLTLATTSGGRRGGNRRVENVEGQSRARQQRQEGRLREELGCLSPVVAPAATPAAVTAARPVAEGALAVVRQAVGAGVAV